MVACVSVDTHDKWVAMRDDRQAVTVLFLL